MTILDAATGGNIEVASIHADDDDEGAQGAPFVTLMALERDDPTGDGRRFADDPFSWRGPPIPLNHMTEVGVGHDGAAVGVGQITQVRRVVGDELAALMLDEAPPADAGIVAFGRFLDTEEGTAAAEFVEQQETPNISVDGGSAAGVGIEFEEICTERDDDDWCIAGYIDFSSFPIGAATIVAIGAIEGAFIRLATDDEIEAAEAEAQTAAAVTTRPRQIEIPALPPVEWFANPQLTGPTPFQLNDDGRCFGHMAAWGVCHTGYPGACVCAPHAGPNGYTMYSGSRAGVLCDNGTHVKTGPIVMGTDHAPKYNADGGIVGPEAAMAWYADNSLAIADVTIGEDKFGIWVAGAARPDLSPTVLRAMMGSAPSGDWRRPGPGLDRELLAILMVNAPAFPVAEMALGVRGSDGHQSIDVLIASAGGVELARRGADERAERVAALDDLQDDDARLARAMHNRLTDELAALTLRVDRYDRAMAHLEGDAAAHALAEIDSRAE